MPPPSLSDGCLSLGVFHKDTRANILYMESLTLRGTHTIWMSPLHGHLACVWSCQGVFFWGGVLYLDEFAVGLCLAPDLTMKGPTVRASLTNDSFLSHTSLLNLLYPRISSTFRTPL